MRDAAAGGAAAVPCDLMMKLRWEGQEEVSELVGGGHISVRGAEGTATRKRDRVSRRRSRKLLRFCRKLGTLQRSSGCEERHTTRGKKHNKVRQHGGIDWVM